MKKKYKLVVGKDLRIPPNINRPISSPATGTPEFARFPALKTRGKQFPAGPVFLREGRHRGPHNGHGFQHIWQEHFSAEPDSKKAEQLVAAFVADIVVAGAAIYYEGVAGGRDNRALVLRHATGVVILEQRQDGQGNAIYTVVTAFPKGQAQGVLIGTI